MTQEDEANGRRVILLGADANRQLFPGKPVIGQKMMVGGYEYTVIGEPVNEAARLTDAAKQRLGRVLASASTVNDAGTEAECWTEAGTVDLRGLAPGLAVFEPRLRV